MLVNDIYKARFICVAGSQIGINVIHFKVAAIAGTGATDLQLAQSLDVANQAVYKVLLSAQADYVGVGVQKIWPLPVSEEASTVASRGAGGVAGDTLPRQVSGLISWGTGLAGRSKRGRIYIPFPGEAESGAFGSPLLGYTAKLVTLGSQLAAPFTVGVGGNTSDMVAVLYHRSTHTTDPRSLKRASTSWATQRRRGDFGKTNFIPI